MFWSKNKKKEYPCKTQFYYIKVGCKGVFVTQTCFRDVHFCMFVVCMSFNTFPPEETHLSIYSFHISGKSTREGKQGRPRPEQSDQGRHVCNSVFILMKHFSLVKFLSSLFKGAFARAKISTRIYCNDFCMEL